jgi:hypothetical protein
MGLTLVVPFLAAIAAQGVVVQPVGKDGVLVAGTDTVSAKLG